MAKFNRFHFPVKPVRILLPISLFSLILLCSPFLLDLSHYMSTYFMQLICFKSDRNYIFLLCNGILVFLIRSSGLTDFSPIETSTGYEHVRKEIVYDQQPMPKLEDNSNIEVQDEQGRATENSTVRNDRNGRLSIEVDDDDGDDEEEDDTLTQQEDDTVVIREEEEEETSLLSAEELNKKCDDFIKKMRRGIHTEAPVTIFV